MDDTERSFHRPHNNDGKRNKVYRVKDAVGHTHLLIAGKDGMTEQWIARIRREDYDERNRNYRYYNKWNGKEYVRSIYSMDFADPDELEHYPSMTDDAQGALDAIVEREDREAFLREFYSTLRSLTENQRRLIYMRSELGLSDVEIAELEGVSPVAINYRWQKIRKKFTKFLR